MTDPGKHYRFEYKGIKLDPFRIASIYKMQSFAMMTILKKCLCAGERGNKDYEQDLKDIISAAERELEIINEDGTKMNIPFDLDSAKNGCEFEIKDTGRWISIFDYCEDRDNHCKKGTSYQSILNNLKISGDHVVIDDGWLNMVHRNDIRLKNQTDK